MKKIYLVLLLAIIFPLNAHAEELDQQKKAAIDELLKLTGSPKVGEMFGNAFINQMTVALKQSNPEVDPKAYDIVKEEIMAVMRDEMVDERAMNEITYPNYHKYLTLSDINQLIAFYKSPIGQKVIQVMPKISSETLQSTQKLVNTIAPKIQQRLQQRFEKEGIVLK